MFIQLYSLGKSNTFCRYSQYIMMKTKWIKAFCSLLISPIRQIIQFRINSVLNNFVPPHKVSSNYEI